MSANTLFTPDGLNPINKNTSITAQDNDSTSPATKPTKPAPSNARRPTTRSQTGTITKRRTRDDDLVPESKKRDQQPARKRHKSSPSTTQDSSSSHTHDSSSSSSSNPPLTRETSLCSTPSSTPPILPSNQNGQLTFYHSSVLESEQPQNRLPRSRTSLPTPIPNLTKKSRGRRVPTKDLADVDPSQKEDRLYVCSVEGCEKCFHRGEHLKRHIRSIHTHEKPFKCTFPLCEKYFNRHDNLLQHLKVHRQANSLPDQPPPVPKRSSQKESHNALVSSTASTRRQSRRRVSYPQPEEEEHNDDDEPVSPPPRPRTIYDAYPSRYGSYPTATTITTTPSSPAIAQMIYNPFSQNNANGEKVMSLHGNEGMSILTNVAVSSLKMEVSSLRTELPRSPVDMRAVMSAMEMNPC